MSIFTLAGRYLSICPRKSQAIRFLLKTRHWVDAEIERANHSSCLQGPIGQIHGMALGLASTVGRFPPDRYRVQGFEAADFNARSMSNFSDEAIYSGCVDKIRNTAYGHKRSR